MIAVYKDPDATSMFNETPIGSNSSKKNLPQ